MFFIQENFDNCRRCNRNGFLLSKSKEIMNARVTIVFPVPPGASRKNTLDSPLCGAPWFTTGASRLLNHRGQQHQIQLSDQHSMMEQPRPLPCAIARSLILVRFLYYQRREVLLGTWKVECFQAEITHQLQRLLNLGEHI